MKLQITLFMLCSLALFIVSCGEDNPTEIPLSEIRGNCEGCHTDEEALIATALPDTTEQEGNGEG